LNTRRQWFVNRFGWGAGARGARACILPDGLKRNYARMKSTEIKMLWKLVKSGEKRPLSAADLALLFRIRFALQKYEATEQKPINAADLTKRQ